MSGAGARQRRDPQLEAERRAQHEFHVQEQQRERYERNRRTISEQYANNRETRDEKQRVRRERRERLTRRLTDLRDRGVLAFELLDEGAGHYRVWNPDRSRHADFWPSTGAILPPGRSTCYGFENLLGYLHVGDRATKHRTN